MCDCMFNELEATTLHFQIGALFLRACSTVRAAVAHPNKACTPGLASGGMLQRIWMLGASPRMANESPHHLLTCWFCASVCCVRNVTQALLCCSQRGPALFLFCFVFLPVPWLARLMADAGVNDQAGWRELSDSLSWTAYSMRALSGCPHWLAEHHQREA